MTNIANIKTILIIRLSSIGDIILTTHIIRNLKKNLPNAKIDFLIGKEFSELIAYNPYINTVWEYDKKSDNESINLLKHKIISTNGKFDLIIDLQSNHRSHSFSAGLSENILRYSKNRFRKLKMVYFKKRYDDGFSVPNEYFKALKPLQIKNDDLGLELYGTNGIIKQIITPNKLIIGIAPGANHFTKRWLPERFRELISKLIIEKDAYIYLFGSEKDQDIVQIILAEINTNEHILDFSGKLSLIETAQKMAECNYFICNDTGLMHIASAIGIPILAIFGSSVIDLGFVPYKVEFKIIQKELNCRPCSHIGRSNCPRGHFKCMKEISTNEVFSDFEIMHNSKKSLN